MTGTLVHRGPDAAGSFAAAGGTGLLGHRRLSIVDLDGGDQPILGRDGNLAVIANGEIYNAPDLRQRMKEEHTFATASDSEVLLHLYEDHGPGLTEHLDGMYAFAIADGDDLLLARDPVGIKPLYYRQDSDALTFASELKSFPGSSEPVREFPPGAVYSSRGGFSNAHAMPDPPVMEDTVEAHARRLRATLEDAVGKRLMSDVPVGAFLSGGLDSSLIAALMRVGDRIIRDVSAHHGHRAGASVLAVELAIAQRQLGGRQRGELGGAVPGVQCVELEAVVEQCRIDAVRRAEVEHHKVFTIELLATHLDKTREDTGTVSWGLVLELTESAEVLSGVGLIIYVTKISFAFFLMVKRHSHDVPFVVATDRWHMSPGADPKESQRSRDARRGIKPSTPPSTPPRPAQNPSRAKRSSG